MIVRNGWGDRGWGDGGDGYMPFTYLRSYATELCTFRLVDGPRRERDGGGPSDVDRPAAGLARLPGVTARGTQWTPRSTPAPAAPIPVRR